MKFKDWLLKYGRWQEQFSSMLGVAGTASFWPGHKEIKPSKKIEIIPERKIDKSKQGIQGTDRDEGSA